MNEAEAAQADLEHRTGLSPQFTRGQVTAAVKRAHDLVDDIAGAPVLDDMTAAFWRITGDGAGPWPREVITGALNDAADEAGPGEDDGETSETIWETDVLNLAVNAGGHLLDHPGATLFDIIASAHEDTELSASEEEDLPPGTAKGSPAWNAALYRTVTGWIA